MKHWQRFLMSLETEGGAIIVLLSLLVMFCWLAYMGFPEAKDQVYFILGGLVGILKGNSEQRITTLVTKSNSPQPDPVKKNGPKKS